MKDSFGRTVDYLRISLTERCNFRCTYCAPDGYCAPGGAPLAIAELVRIVRAAVAEGITHIRLTGGEPLMRRDIVDVVSAIAAIGGVQDLALTTNGFRLAALAAPLKAAGLRRVNVSLDSLRPEVFARIVGQDAFARVWRGICAAEAERLAPLKLNVVMLRDVNDDEAGAFAALTLAQAWHVRFIELMPIGVSEASRAYFDRHFMRADEWRQRLPPLEPSAAPAGNGPARTFRLPNAHGTVGFITPASEHFCASCNRLRLTARGALIPCLFSAQAFPIRDVPGGELRARVVAAVRAKPENHPWGESFTILSHAMAEMGG